VNKLLADYNAALKAIFDHCGVPENLHGDGVVIIHDRWGMNFHGNLRILTTEGADTYGDTTVLYRGKTITLVNVDTAGDEWHPEHAWYVLDNALEIET
jgi:hypothetical protein